ncbi:MAG: hypothetical protein M1834_002946 [Cirrosporium novae-zelandiae]|nr:MAG: hypothetical protein M1834_002946 [Cirrosporium novae-zelandiae]
MTQLGGDISKSSLLVSKPPPALCSPVCRLYLSCAPRPSSGRGSRKVSRMQQYQQRDIEKHAGNPQWDLAVPNMNMHGGAQNEYSYTTAEESDQSNDHALWIMFAYMPRLLVHKEAIPDRSAFATVEFLYCIYSKFDRPLPQLDLSDECSTFYTTLIVLLLAPFLSVGVAMATWVAAFFWAFAAILGDPDGRSSKDDGRAAVLGVKSWWESWFRRALK